MNLKNLKTKNLYNLSLVLLLFAGFSLGCSMMEDVGAAKEAAERFHAQVEKGAFDEIYDEAAPEFRNTISRQALIADLQKLKKLGAVREMTQTGFETNTKNGLTITSVKFETVFSGGKLQESFKYKMSDGKAELIGYEFEGD